MTLVTDNETAQRALTRETITNGVTTQFVVDNGVKTWVNSRDGGPVHNWREKIRQGKNATSTYLCTFEEWLAVSHYAQSRLTQKSGSYQQFVTTGNLSFWSVSPSGAALLSSTKADTLAREQFIKQYRGRRTAFQSGVFLGELSETVQMIRHPAQALRQGIDRYYGTVKKRLRRKKRDKRLIQDTWLEYVFGWKPLINDIEDACRLATVQPMANFQVIRGSGKDVISKAITQGNFTYGSTKTLWSYVKTGSVDVTCKGAVSAVNEPPPFPEVLGLSWSNVLPTVWELIPYSFLVDYFTNVGKVIDGISTGNIQLAWGCKTVYKQSEVQITNLHLDDTFLQGNKPVGGSVSGFATGGGKAATSTNIVRQPITGVSLGLGDFRFKLPGSDTRWLNIGALARLKS